MSDCTQKELRFGHKISKWFINLVPFGFNIESVWTVNIVDEYFKCKELLFKEYFINNLSPSDIYKKYNCNLYIHHPETILHILKSFGFKTRTTYGLIRRLRGW